MKKIILTLSIVGLSIIFTSCTSAEEKRLSTARKNFILAVANEKGQEEVQKAYDEMIKEETENQNRIREKAEKKK